MGLVQRAPFGFVLVPTMMCMAALSFAQDPRSSESPLPSSESGIAEIRKAREAWRVERDLFALLFFSSILEPEIGQMIEVSDDAQGSFAFANLGAGAALTVGWYRLAASLEGTAVPINLERSIRFSGVALDALVHMPLGPWADHGGGLGRVARFFFGVAQAPAWFTTAAGRRSSLALSGGATALATGLASSGSGPSLPHFKTMPVLDLLDYDSDLRKKFRSFAEVLAYFFGVESYTNQIRSRLAEVAMAQAMEHNFDPNAPYHINLIDVFDDLTDERGNPVLPDLAVADIQEVQELFTATIKENDLYLETLHPGRGHTARAAIRREFSIQEKRKMLEILVGTLESFLAKADLTQDRHRRAEKLKSKIKANLVRHDLFAGRI